MVSTVETNQDRDVVFQTVDNFLTVEVSFLKLLKCPFLNCQDQGEVNNWAFRALALLWCCFWNCWELLDCWDILVETGDDPESRSRPSRQIETLRAIKKTSTLFSRPHFLKIISGGSRVWKRLGSQIPSNFQAGCPSSPIQKGTSTTRSPTSPT